MEQRYTREEFLKKYPNPFKLVNYAIDQARDMVISGRPSRIVTKVRNPAYIVLEEIAQGKDKLEDIPQEEEQEEITEE